MHDEHGERAVASGGGMDGPGDAFCVVISSIPGYGFCGPSRQLGWDTERVRWSAQPYGAPRPGLRPLLGRAVASDEAGWRDVLPKDAARAVRRRAGKILPALTHWTRSGRGGHFAAMEQLKLYVSDVRTFARTVRWSLAARAITGSSY